MITGIEIAQRAKEQLSQLTGLRSDTVSSLRKEADGWHVTVELIEMRRIPDSTDVLGSYSVLLDDEGNLVSYQRTRRYHRGQVADE